MLPFTLAGCSAAFYLFNSQDVETLTKAMAVFIIFFAIYQLLPLPRLHGSRIWAGPVGLIGTLFGTGGLFYMIYLNLRGLDKNQTRASFATYFFIDGSVRIFGFVYFAIVGFADLKALLAWIPAATAGLFIGGRIQTNIAVKTFKYFISLLLVLSGYRLLTR